MAPRRRISSASNSIVVEKENNSADLGSNLWGKGHFVLANPKVSDARTKSLLQEVLSLYMKELPAMNYAANTGKESTFLAKCVTNGKYCTLVLKFKDDEQPGEVIAAITYQIVPADTQYAEVPLAAVHSAFQHKGIGHLLYLELRKRLQSVGVCTILCWGDKESEGFWLKQDFEVIGEVNKKGRARRLPIKADIRRSLCFPGGSTLMASHLIDDSSLNLVQIPLPCSQAKNLKGLHTLESRETCEAVKLAKINRSQSENILENGALPVVKLSSVAKASGLGECGSMDNEDSSSFSLDGTKKRIWEASSTSLKSKKVKGAHSSDSYPIWTEDGGIVNCPDRNCSQTCKGKLLLGLKDVTKFGKNEECKAHNLANEDAAHGKISVVDISKRIMLMNIADENKRSCLIKVVEGLGGAVTATGSTSSHVVTGKVRQTFNFCIALCSGSWVVSPGWLKESFKKGKFVDEMPFVLEDEEHRIKYRTDLKSAVLRARSRPNALFRGLDIWISSHVQPQVSSIVKFAGGNVIGTEKEVKVASKSIFIACEEDMDEVLSAVELGVWTFSVDWLMSCLMRQQLDLDAPQFAESL